MAVKQVMNHLPQSQMVFLKNASVENQFISCFTKLLDETGKMSRNEWADYLCVSPSAITQWVKGQTIPRSEHLEQIILYIERFKDKDTLSILNEFYKMADKPLSEFLPAEMVNKFKGSRTLADYISKSYLPVFHAELSNVPSLVRRDFLALCTRFSRNLNEMYSKKRNSNFYQFFVMKKSIQALPSNKFSDWIGEEILRSKSLHKDSINKSHEGDYFRDILNKDFLSNCSIINCNDGNLILRINGKKEEILVKVIGQISNLNEDIECLSSIFC